MFRWPGVVAMPSTGTQLHKDIINKSQLYCNMTIRRIPYGWCVATVLSGEVIDTVGVNHNRPFYILFIVYYIKFTFCINNVNTKQLTLHGINIRQSMLYCLWILTYLESPIILKSHYISDLLVLLILPFPLVKKEGSHKVSFLFYQSISTWDIQNEVSYCC